MNDGSFSFDPNFAQDTVGELQAFDQPLDDQLAALQRAMTNFMDNNDTHDHMDEFHVAQTNFQKGHDDHHTYLKGGYTALINIADNYHQNDVAGSQGFAGATRSY